MRPRKLTFKLVQSFSVGFAIHSPSLNGLSFEIYLGCFHVAFWNRGIGAIGFANYWPSANTPGQGRPKQESAS